MKLLASKTTIAKKPFGRSPLSKKVVSKPAKKVEPDFELDEAPDDEDDDEEVTPVSPKKARALALLQAPSLGIQDFEVVRDEPPEDFLTEDVNDENRQENIRRNDELIIAPTKLPGPQAKRVRGIVTMFGQRSDTILRLLENQDETDGALTLIHRTLLQTMVDVLPVVERAVRRSKGRRGIIPMNQLVSQIRELVTDIQSLRDKGQLGASIVDRVVRPAYLDIASQIALAFLEIENSAKNRMAADEFKSYRDDVLMTTKKNIARYIQDQYESIKSEVVNSLS